MTDQPLRRLETLLLMAVGGFAGGDLRWALAAAWLVAAWLVARFG